MRWLAGGAMAALLGYVIFGILDGGTIAEFQQRAHLLAGVAGQGLPQSMS